MTSFHPDFSSFDGLTSARNSGAAGNYVSGNALRWRTSSRSTSGGGNCVEVGALRSHVVAVRDSKDRDGGMLIVGAAPWTAFLDTVRDGRLG